MKMGGTIEEILHKRFSPHSLSVQDDSHKHAGHSGWKSSGDSHFTIQVVSEHFAGKSLMQRHRLIYQALENEMKQGIHALAIQAFTPEEWAQKKENK